MKKYDKPTLDVLQMTQDVIMNSGEQFQEAGAQWVPDWGTTWIPSK